MFSYLFRILWDFIGPKQACSRLCKNSLILFKFRWRLFRYFQIFVSRGSIRPYQERGVWHPLRNLRCRDFVANLIICSICWTSVDKTNIGFFLLFYFLRFAWLEIFISSRYFPISLRLVSATQSVFSTSSGQMRKSFFALPHRDFDLFSPLRRANRTQDVLVWESSSFIIPPLEYPYLLSAGATRLMFSGGAEGEQGRGIKSSEDFSKSIWKMPRFLSVLEN